MKNTPEAYGSSGLHILDSIPDRQADILLNKRCNLGAAKIGFPYNRTCCSLYPLQVPSQIILVILGAIVLHFNSHIPKATLGANQFSPNTGTDVCIFFFATLNCYQTDRLLTFEKANKQYYPHEFLGVCLLSAMIGRASVRKNTDRVPLSRSDVEDTRDSGFLSRNQTEEWKGWMQCIVLLYHYTGASKIRWIYKLVRLLVASYLFMTGYGHTVYFLRSGRFSNVRPAFYYASTYSAVFFHT